MRATPYTGPDPASTAPCDTRAAEANEAHRQLPVRRLKVDLRTPFDRHWVGGDVFRSAWFNALSMSFPSGEQFFIDALKGALPLMSEADRVKYAAEIKGFIGQEATHRHLHAQFNKHLADLGYVNAWEPRFLRRAKILEGKDPRHAVAITAAVEHFTAMLSTVLLTQPQLLAGADKRLQQFWLWHASEEAEHRATALEVYRAVGGDEAHRMRWMRRVTVFFAVDALRQTAANLARDGQLWRWSTWRDGWHFFFGDKGLVTLCKPAWKDYFRPGFHPLDHPAEQAHQWLADNRQLFDVVGQTPAPQT